VVAIDGAAWEDGPGGLPFLRVETDRCRARLTSYGGQLCEWTPAGQAPVLFLSPHSAFAVGTPIRGGVPICFPWFGPHPTDATKPAHGFARTRTWQVTDVARESDGDVRVVLRLAADADTRALWNAPFTLSLTLLLGAALEMTAEVENVGDDAIVYELALHSYLAVGDLEAVRIRGLERTRFVDKVDGGKEKVAGAEPLAIAGETDRVFLDTTTTCVIDDPVLARRLRIEKRDSRATVVWNPGRDRARTMRDVGEESWRRFVCVEAANVGPHAVRLAPRARHAMSARIDVTSERGA
jgi:glucose-6-phosphate 1-epimerase